MPEIPDSVANPKGSSSTYNEMEMKLPLQIVFLAVTVAALCLFADAWRTARRDSQQLAVTLAARNSILQQANEQEKQRDSQLDSALAAIQAEKRAVHTPEQAAQELPDVLPPLPLPLAIHIPSLSAKPASSSELTAGSAEQLTGATTDNSPRENTETFVSIPRPDLIPLYNGLQDCRAAQLQTAALKDDLASEKARSAALLQARNAALAAAHGGSVLQRLKRSAKWFAMGLATGATLAFVLHH